MNIPIRPLRWKYLIDAKVQLKIFFVIFTCVTILFLAFILLQTSLFAPLEQQIQTIHMISDNSILQYFENFRVHSMWSIIIIIIGGTISLFFINLFITHRAVGAVYQILTVLKNNKANNKKDKIVLRKEDFFHDLADEINELIK